MKVVLPLIALALLSACKSYDGSSSGGSSYPMSAPAPAERAPAS